MSGLDQNELGLDDTSTFVTSNIDSLRPLIRQRRAALRGASMANQRERVRDRSHDRPATLHPLPGDHSAVEPPDPIPNSEVKRSRADGSVHPHARVGHRQGLTPKPPQGALRGFSFARPEHHASPRPGRPPSGIGEWVCQTKPGRLIQPANATGARPARGLNPQPPPGMSPPARRGATAGPAPATPPASPHGKPDGRPPQPRRRRQTG